MDHPAQPQPAQVSQYQQQTTTTRDKPPPPHVSPRSMWLSKLVFRILSALFSVALIGLVAYVGANWYGGLYGLYGASPLVIMLPPAILGFIWDVVEIFCILARGGHRGVHPGSVVALDLLLWLGFIVATVFYALYHVGDWYYYDSYWYDYEDLPSISEGSITSRVIVALGSLEVLIHLLLFIFGCSETHIRNRKTAPVVFVPGPMGYMPPPPPRTGPQHYSQYGAPAPGQPIMLPAGQAPPPGYVAYSYGPKVGAVDQHYPAPAQSPPPQQPSPVHTASTSAHGDWRNSYQPTTAPGQPAVGPQQAYYQN